MKLKPKKCEFFKNEVSFLGHKVNKEGVQTDPKKTNAVSDWPKPECVKDVRTFLGFSGYYWTMPVL